MTTPKTSSHERAELSEIALAVGREAGALVAAGYRSRPHADEKGRADLVTEFDRASEALLLTRLGALSSIPIVAEESAFAGGEGARREGLVWFVDPLDGTTNFVHGHPFWCVAVGLMQDDVPIAGAIVAPTLGLSWRAWISPSDTDRGEALRNGEPCRVSPVADLGHAMIGTGFPPNRLIAPANNFASFQSVKRAAQAVRRCGSAALDLCMVADGTYEGYWERSLHAWDVVGAGAVVLAAGGRITNLTGGRPDYHVGNVIASNGLCHDALVAAVNG